MISKRRSETTFFRTNLILAAFMACVVLAVCGYVAPATAATYYVRPGGSDSRGGTANTAAGAWKIYCFNEIWTELEKKRC